MWVPSEDFDISHHVRTRALPPAADEATLLAACAELNEVPLDRSRPLWEIWLLTGIAGSRIGILIRLHHVIADGVAALAMLVAPSQGSAARPAAAANQEPPTLVQPAGWAASSANTRTSRSRCRESCRARARRQGQRRCAGRSRRWDAKVAGEPT